MSKADLHVPTHPVRFVTAASLFDGHDASINIMRRILQSQGAEVVHLGHNRSVDEVVDAAICEDVQGVAISSYQGGHVEYFEYLVDLLAERGAGHVHVYGGGGGVIVPAEIARLREHGVRIFSPEDGQRLGLAAMVNTMVADCDTRLADLEPASWDGLLTGDRLTLARALTMAEVGALPRSRARAGRRRHPAGPGARHHGHRRVRQVLAHRRAAAPVPARSGRQGADRGARCRPDPPAGRWRPAGRPDPDELDHRRGCVVGVLPLDGHARHHRWPPRAPRRRRGGAEGVRGRPRGGRDAGHRPGRRRDRAVLRHLPLRDDAGVRRLVPAREDRHARLRRRRGDQQVRAPRRRGRPSRRRPPARAQPRGVRLRPGRHARVRDLGRDLQRRRRHGALPVPARPARGAGPRRRHRPAHRGLRQGLHQHARDHPAGPGAVPVRHRRVGPRLPPHHPGAGGRRPARGPAAGCRNGSRRGGCRSRRPRRRPGQRRGGGRPGDQGPARRVARHRARLLRRGARRDRARARDPHRAPAADAVRQPGPAGGAPARRRGRRARPVPALGEPAGSLPLHGRGLRLQARGRGPGADVRRRGRRLPHQPPVPVPVAATARRPGCRPPSTR